jgi:hypothetical protein
MIVKANLCPFVSKVHTGHVELLSRTEKENEWTAGQAVSGKKMCSIKEESPAFNNAGLLHKVFSPTRRQIN